MFVGGEARVRRGCGCVDSRSLDGATAKRSVLVGHERSVSLAFSFMGYAGVNFHVFHVIKNRE